MQPYMKTLSMKWVYIWGICIDMKGMCHILSFQSGLNTAFNILLMSEKVLLQTCGGRRLLLWP